MDQIQREIRRNRRNDRARDPVTNIVFQVADLDNLFPPKLICSGALPRCADREQGG